ncbi:MAG TPA: DNA polymerase III subunit delta, partial [Draconibacterium sp.]|nr:DNA polymerase III subunit delta [Draconibacterium sp.]
MEFNEILQNLKKGIYHPIYLLQGEEAYFIDQLTEYIEDHVLPDAEKGFNQTIFYGKDSDPVTIVEASMRFPMMASKQVIIVKEAQSLNKIDTLTSYAEKPLASTILVLAYKYKYLDSRTKLAKAIKKNGILFTSKKLYENKIPNWIDIYLKAHNYSITPQAAILLTSYLGTDLSKIANELNKLVIAVKDSTKITPDHIEKNIGLSKEFNVLELQNALGEKDVLKANRIIKYFGANPTLNPIQKTIAGLYFYFSKLFTYHFLKDKTERNVAAELRVHPFFVKD